MSLNKSKEKSVTAEKHKEPCHKKLTDVGLYSIAGLCAVSMSQLFSEECQENFKKKTLTKILHEFGQPKQTNDSMFALMEGEIMTECDAFVDSLMAEECLKESRQPLIVELITIAINEGCYDARMRVLIKHIAWQLRVTWDDVEAIEEEFAETLEYDTYVMSEEEMKEKAKKSRNRKVKRYALIGLATVGGGALIGLTGGLAAPLVAAGAGAVIGGAGAAALGSAAGVAIIGSLFGVAGAGLTGYKMKRRVGAIDEFAFEPLTLMGSRLNCARSVKQLHITIAVTGWINDRLQDFRIPWSALADSKEQYSVRWESKYLYQLGEAFDYLLQTGLSMATTEALKYTVLSGIISAIAWPAALIAASGAIDNPWHVCTQRATETGKQLAEVLLAREQGNRPVTLIGFSLGARVIFSCLEELAKRKGGEGLVEDVILLGAPVSGDPKNWQPLIKVVGGKIVNGYARGDWLLKFLYRTASVTFHVAGLSPVKWDNRRMHNIDLSDIIDGHGDYKNNLDIILKAVGVRTKDELKITQKFTKEIGELKEFPIKPDVENVNGACVTNTGNVRESNSESRNDNEANKSRTSSELKLEDSSLKFVDMGEADTGSKTTATSETPSNVQTDDNITKGVREDSHDEPASAIKKQSAIIDKTSEKNLNTQGDLSNGESIPNKDGHENAGDKSGDGLNSMGFVCVTDQDKLKSKDTDKCVTAGDEDEEGCYFTDSNPESDEEDENVVKS
ncbi:transmembrane and coiled-coil domain-containing protein 4-like [Ruditapes philippinarum]|uniref:transmembrane and coiled-coil domain-containing protein 4-like n=1 Tax=Ruditapes philippinarum TaxID=129788 RepID=UPI00295C3803|nr:transmembrane and coiled-coil domain-containing protein 4-like [Ruditapes philippinarum]